jgi:hypothetical protein
MTRVPISVALLMLSQSGYHLKPATLRSWVHRGHITRGKGGYCVREIVAYIDRRDAPKERLVAICSLDDCDSQVSALGYCVKHYRRFKKHGDPEAGVAVGYDGMHARLRRGRGSAGTHMCEFCGFQAVDWAYDHDDLGEITDERGRVFSRNQDHYIPLCRYCHRVYDTRHAQKLRRRCAS